MFNLPFAFGFIAGPLFLSVIAVVLFLFEPWSFTVLGYERNAVETWQLWRFFSANLLHSNGTHLIMNLLAILAVWALHGEHYPLRRYAALCFGLGVFCTVCIYFFTPERSSYVGLSGVIHGLLLYGSCLDIRNKIWLGWVLLVGVWLKIIQEQLYGASATTAELIQASVAIEAHLYGAIGGAMCGLLALTKAKRQN